jgi:hypothetical protein
MSTVSRNCRNRLQRSQGGGETMPPFSGSQGPAPGTLRSLLSHDCSNSRRMVQPFSSLPPFCAGDIIELAFASVRLCESEPWKNSHMKSVGQYGSSKILAQIAASQGCYNPVQTPRSLPTKLRSPKGVFRSNGGACGLFVRASAQFFPQICNRAEARWGHFPLLALQVPGIAPLRSDAGPLQHQTGPP